MTQYIYPLPSGVIFAFPFTWCEHVIKCITGSCTHQYSARIETQKRKDLNLTNEPDEATQRHLSDDSNNVQNEATHQLDDATVACDSR